MNGSHRERTGGGDRNQIGRKSLQLCGQVRHALHGIVSGLADEVLQNLLIVSVESAPHTGRLMVTVAVPDPADATDRAAGLIRREIAAAVHRRKAPELVFRVV